MNCSGTFCNSALTCENLEKRLSPVAFQFSEYIFEMNPSQYLFQDEEKSRCYILIHKCTLPGQNANLFLVGDVFLRNFYSVFDFEKN